MDALCNDDERRRVSEAGERGANDLNDVRPGVVILVAETRF